MLKPASTMPLTQLRSSLVGFCQGSHTPFWDWGLGPLELGKIAAFCLKLGKNNKTFVIYIILVSFNMFKCICIFIHTVLLEIHVRFHILFYSNLSFFSPFFSIFSQGVKLGKLGVWIGKKRYYFALGMGPNIGPKLGRSRALVCDSTHKNFIKFLLLVEVCLPVTL